MASVLADSSAVLDQDRLLAQHQAALTLIQRLLQNPNVSEFTWLDLACGRGQIIVHLEHNLSQTSRSKIHYHIYDVKASYVNDTRRRADSLGLKSIVPVTSQLAKMPDHYPATEKFDFITFTNTVHELAPLQVATSLVDCVLRLKPNGSLFVYDFETFPDSLHELGAIAWTRAEVQELIKAMLTAFGVTNYQPEVGQWKHKSCFGWNINLEREHFGSAHADLVSKRDSAITALKECMMKLLQRKLLECRQMLESFTEEGTETAGEEQEKVGALYNFWALSRIIDQNL